MNGDRTLLNTFVRRAATQPREVAYREFGGGVLTWAEWEHAARSVAAALIDGGCMPGDVVAVLAGNSMLWPIADIGALMAGCITVGVYPSSAAVQVHEVLKDCAARVAIADGPEQLAKILQVRPGLPSLRTIVSAAPCNDRTVANWTEWLARGRAALPALTDTVNERMADAQPGDIAILIYTSGSTGVPKGARISHGYLSTSAVSIQTALGLDASDTTLSYLPFSHGAERIFGLYTRIHTGMSAVLVPRIADLWEAARQSNPTLFGGLPRFFEKIYEALLAEHASLAREEREGWDRGIAAGRQRSLRLRNCAPVPADLEAEWRAQIAPARRVIEQMLGSRVRLATSGGATLPGEVAEYLAACGLAVLGAYGMTEHLCVSIHRPDAHAFDSVGAPMPGTTLRISETGEILVQRSALTFSGYQNKPEETRAMFTEDGQWLCSGDIGFLDAKGYLHVTGREKELIALSGGKKVAPVPIERRLMESPWISQAVLFGEGRKYISALIALRRTYVEQWAYERHFDLAYAELLGTADLRGHLQREIDAVNANLSRPEQVRRFALLPDELTDEREELTPTMKVRRNVVEERYRHQIESLYGHE